MTTGIAIHGAAGRMGRRLIALCLEDPTLRLTEVADAPDCPCLGQDAGVLAGINPIGITLRSGLAQGGDVVIDFSNPQATRQAMAFCRQKGCALVIGTTGLSDTDQQAIDAAAKTIAILQAPNMSLGVNLLIALAAQVARQLGDGYDIEIAETHHRFKKDAPSGTALALLDAVVTATGRNRDTDTVYGRHGIGPARPSAQIGVHALRMGDAVGEHTVYFAGLGERLELHHLATSRDVFVRGALRAAKWLAGKPAGRYHMTDVLGL
jgi:4-hydroxy-tetrahydrodipicolinate reductase